MVKFSMQIRNIKNIKHLDFDIPTEKGLYALTGENGSGKSTIVASAASSFYVPWLYDYFGEPRDNSEIRFELNGRIRKIVSKENRRWKNPSGNLGIAGFYEGSIVYGNRFKNADYQLVSKLSKITANQVKPASDFIRKNLGSILHDNEEYYRDLYILKQSYAKKLNIESDLFYYYNHGSLVSQLQMSTGENLLLTVLRSLEIRINKNNTSSFPTYVYLDEIELALHSASIHRFILFLESLVKQYNLVTIFSTHSSDILRRVLPENIYYVQNISDGVINLLNPCYPAFATRRLESAEYGYDFIVLVEDFLAQFIVDRILKEKRLLANKKVLVLPIGGWRQVLRFANDVIYSHLAPVSTRVLIVLDRDVKDQVPGTIEKEKLKLGKGPQYLPIQSVEKFLLDNLVTNLDYTLMEHLDNYIFGVPTEQIIRDYNKKLKNGDYNKEDGNYISGISNGKQFYKLVIKELTAVRKTQEELVQSIIEYLFEKNDSNLQELVEFFKKEIK